MQDGEIEYRLCKNKAFSPFATTHWQLTDGRMDSPGTILIKRAPFAAHVSFERRDGSLIADMGQRMLMTGSEFTWCGKVYR